jgi:hypothetical protein
MPVPELVKSVADLLEVILPILNVTIVGGDLKVDLNKLEPEIKSEVSWDGEAGYLIYVPVGENASTHQLIYGGAQAIGAGPTPEKVLALRIQHRIPEYLTRPAPDPISEEHTFYIWYDAKQDAWKPIEYPYSQALKTEAFAISNDMTLLNELDRQRRDEIYLHAIDVLKSRVTNDAERTIALKSAQKLRSSYEEVDRINKHLREVLQKVEAAEQFQQKLKLMSSAISLANLVVEAKTLFPDAGISDSDDRITLDRKVAEYKEEYGNYVVRFRGQLEIQRKLTNEEAEQLRPLLKEQGAPNEVLNWDLP